MDQSPAKPRRPTCMPITLVFQRTACLKHIPIEVHPTHAGFSIFALPIVVAT